MCGATLRTASRRWEICAARNRAAVALAAAARVQELAAAARPEVAAGLRSAAERVGNSYSWTITTETAETIAAEFAAITTEGTR